MEEDKEKEEKNKKKKKEEKSMEDFLLNEQRTIYLHSEIDTKTMLEVIKKIHFLEKKDKKKPIKLNISSYGGSVYDMFALIDAIENSSCQIHTIATGKVMSAGAIIFVCGDKRFITKNTRVMFHEVSSWGEGKLNDLQTGVMECIELQKMINKILLKRTKLAKNMSDMFFLLERDRYLSAKEAIKYKCADKII